MENTETKVCSKCGLDKPLSDFYFRKCRNRHDTICCDCRHVKGQERWEKIRSDKDSLAKKRLQNKNWGLNNSGRVADNKKRSYEKNKERISEENKNKHRQNPQNAMFLKAKQRAKYKGIDFDLTIEDIVIPEVCPVLGIPLMVSDGSSNDNSPTLDRIDNAKGYVKGNVYVISFRANSIKRDATLDELKRIVEYIEKSV